MRVTSKEDRYKGNVHVMNKEEKRKILENTNAYINYVKCTKETSDCPHCGRVHLTRPNIWWGWEEFPYYLNNNLFTPPVIFIILLTKTTQNEIPGYSIHRHQAINICTLIIVPENTVVTISCLKYCFLRLENLNALLNSKVWLLKLMLHGNFQLNWSFHGAINKTK